MPSEPGNEATPPAARKEALEYLQSLASSNEMWGLALARATSPSCAASVRHFCLSLVADRLNTLVSAGDGGGVAEAPLEGISESLWEMVEAEVPKAGPQYVLAKLGQVLVALGKARAGLEGTPSPVLDLFTSFLLPQLKDDPEMFAVFFLVVLKEFHAAVIDNDFRRSSPDATLCSAILEAARASSLPSDIIDALLGLAEASRDGMLRPHILPLALEVLAEVTGWIDTGLVLHERTLDLLYGLLLAPPPRVAATHAVSALQALVSKGMDPEDKLGLIQSLSLPSLLDGMELDPETPPDSDEVTLLCAVAGLVAACTQTLSSSYSRVLRGDQHEIAAALRDAIFETLQLCFVFASATEPDIILHPVAAASDFVSRFKRGLSKEGEREGAAAYGITLDESMTSLLVALLELVASKTVLPENYYADNDLSVLLGSSAISVLIDDATYEAVRSNLFSLFSSISRMAPALVLTWLCPSLRNQLEAVVEGSDSPLDVEPYITMLFELGEVLRSEFATATQGSADVSADPSSRHMNIPPLESVLNGHVAADDPELVTSLGPAFIVEAFLDVVESDLLSDSRAVVKRAMYDILSRYVSLLAYAPATAAPVFRTLLSECGQLQSQASLAPRFGSLVVKMTSELASLLGPDLETILEMSNPLIHPHGLIAPYVAEALGILIVGAAEEDLSPEHRGSLTQSLLETLVSIIDEMVEGYESEESMEPIANALYTLASFSKAYSITSGLIGPFEPAYEQTLRTVWSLRLVPPPSGLTSKLFSFVHCMVDTIGASVLAGVPILSEMYLCCPETYDSDAASGLSMFLGLLNQVIPRFREDVVDVVAPLMGPLLSSVIHLARISPSGRFALLSEDSMASHPIRSEYDREVDNVIRVTLSSLVTLFSTQIAVETLSTSFSSSEEVLDSLTTLAHLALPGSTNSRRSLFQLVRYISDSGVEGLDAFLFQTGLPLAFGTVTHPTFDLSDARMTLYVLSEVGQVVRSMYATREEGTVAWIRSELGGGFAEELIAGLRDGVGDKAWARFFAGFVAHLR